MSQVVSVTVAKDFTEACSAFRIMAGMPEVNDSAFVECDSYLVNFNEEASENSCEGRISEQAFVALQYIANEFSGQCSLRDLL